MRVVKPSLPSMGHPHSHGGQVTPDWEVPWPEGARMQEYRGICWPVGTGVDDSDVREMIDLAMESGYRHSLRDFRARRLVYHMIRIRMASWWVEPKPNAVKPLPDGTIRRRLSIDTKNTGRDAELIL